MHLQPRFATQAEAIRYCMKTDTRVDGPWEAGQPLPGEYILDDLETEGENDQVDLETNFASWDAEELRMMDVF